LIEDYSKVLTGLLNFLYLPLSLIAILNFGLVEEFVDSFLLVEVDDLEGVEFTEFEGHVEASALGDGHLDEMNVL
jgi:hypothetical protein